MPELDQVQALATPPARHDRPVLEGKLKIQRADRWAIIDGSQQLLGPLKGADSLPDGEVIGVAIGQNGTPFVIYPSSGGGGMGNVDGGFPDSIYGGTGVVDGGHLGAP